MARDGSGTYSLPEAAFVYGDVIDESAVNNNFSDIATALSQSMSKDGQTTPTANQDLDSYKHTSVGNASARDQYAAAGQVQDSSFTWCGTAGGTGNAITLTPTPAITAYATGQSFRFVASADSTSTVTVAISGLATKAVQINGAALSSTVTIENGKLYQIDYDGTQFQATRLSATVINKLSDIPTHDYLPLEEQASAPSTAANEMALYTKETNSTSEAFIREESDGDEVQVTLGGVLAGEVLDSAYAEYATYSNTSAVLPADDTIPQNTEGTELLSVAITPKSTSSKLYCVWEGMFAHGTSGQNIAVAMFRNGVANAIAATAETSTSGSPLQKLSDSVEISPSTTSEVTISVRYGTGGSGTVYVNGGAGSRTFGGVAKVTLKVFEIKG